MLDVRSPWVKTLAGLTGASHFFFGENVLLMSDHTWRHHLGGRRITLVPLRHQRCLSNPALNERPLPITTPSEITGRALSGARLFSSAITATPGGVVLAASGTLASLAAGSTGWALLDVRPFVAVKFQASAAVDGADLTIRATGRT